METSELIKRGERGNGNQVSLIRGVLKSLGKTNWKTEERLINTDNTCGTKTQTLTYGKLNVKGRMLQITQTPMTIMNNKINW